MLVLPIPLVAALALAALSLRTALAPDRSRLLSALLGLAAAQGVVVSLVQHYGVTELRPLQPLAAAAIPPLAWVTLRRTAVSRGPWLREAAHLAAPAAAAAALAFAPDALDAVLPGAFLYYGARIGRVAAEGADAMPLARLDIARPGLVWGGVSAALILSAATDGLITLAMLSGAGAATGAILSVSTSITLALIGALALAESLARPPEAVEAQPAPAAERLAAAVPDERDEALMTRLSALMAGKAPWLDPDLTLDRLARRLGAPAKQLSGAINRSTGGSVSRYVNGFRVERACALLLEGESVTGAMLGAGFNTKSNFNREFLRVTGAAPSAWLAARRARDGAVRGVTPSQS